MFALREIHKSKKKEGDPVVLKNDVVLIYDEKQSRSTWKENIAQDNMPSKDR